MIDFKLLINKAKDLGFDDIEIVESSAKALELSLFNSKIDQNVLSEDNSISIRGLFNEKMASIRVENFECDIDKILNTLKQNVLSIESEEKNEIFEGSEQYPVLERNEFDFNSIPTAKKINLLLAMEKKCKELDNRVVAVSNCFYEEVDCFYSR